MALPVQNVRRSILFPPPHLKNTPWFQLQGYLLHEKTPPPRTLQQVYALGPPVVTLGGWALYHEKLPCKELHVSAAESKPLWPCITGVPR